MIKLKADISGFLKDWDRISKEIPEAVVKGFARTAERGRDAVRRQTREVFNLHSEYIPQSIRSYPDRNRPKAIASATRGLMRRHGDFEAGVYLRGNPNPKKSLDFMVEHETGGRRQPVKHKDLATPSLNLENYSYRTSRGKTRRAWKPAKLLEHYNLVGGAVKGSLRRNKQKTRGKPKPFILESTKGHGKMIARRRNRKTRYVEILYRFLGTAQIDKRWGFARTVHREALAFLSRDVVSQLNKLR